MDSDLILWSSKAAALHGAGVVVTIMIHVTQWVGTPQFIQDWRQSSPEGHQMSATVVNANTHAALL